MNFSFAGCGFLGIYHVGVASCLKQHAPELLQDCHFSGASAGAILACCLISDCSLGVCTSFVLRLATKARSLSLGPLHPNFKVVQIMKDALMEFLPANAYQIASGRLHISLTRLSDRENVMVSEFSSNAELIQALMCSAFVPLYSGLVPPTFRGVRYVDGGLSDNIPILNKETITVSPFAGESDICPTDNSSNFIHVNLANTSMQCSMENMYRLSRALFPPKPEILSDMCKQGFEDCSRYLQRNNLLSCIRHMSVRSFVIPVQVSEKDIEVVISNHRACDMDAESNEDCQECKNKVEKALLHNLPPAVVSAFQSACDSVNKGVTAYIHRHRSLRLMSYVITPWFLPLDIAYNFTLRFLQYLPSLPYDLHHCYREIREVCRAVRAHLQHEKRQYTARFSCQLAITEVNFDNAQQPVSSLSGRNEPQPQPLPPLPIVRNLNIGFAVDFDTHVQDTAKSHHSEGKIDNIKISQIQLQSGISGQNTLVQTDPMHVPSAGFNVPCTQIFDTFDQCLRVSNQMDSVLAYYYYDENNRQCINFQEIFSLDNTEINIPSPETGQGSVTLDNVSEISLDSLAEAQPNFLTDLEELIETTMAISSDQAKEQ